MEEEEEDNDGARAKHRMQRSRARGVLTQASADAVAGELAALRAEFEENGELEDDDEEVSP